MPIVSYMGVQTARAEAGSPSFRVVNFNTWFRNHDYAEIGRFLEKTQPDVIVFEERTQQEALRLGEFLTSYPYSFNEPRPHGVVIFARWPITSAESLPLAEGGVPGSGRAGGFLGLFTTGGTPAGVVRELSAQVEAILAMPPVQQNVRTLTAAVAYEDENTFAQFLDGEAVKWKAALASLAPAN